MALDYEYGINTGNRFLDFVDHDEDPDEFIATKSKPEEKPPKLTKDTKSSASTTAKKSTTTPATSTANVSSNTTKTNKENFTGKSTSSDQRRQQSNVFSDNNNQQTRFDSGRGGGRGFSRRGGSAGQDRPPYEGGNRGGGQQRTQRYQKFEGQSSTNQTGSFEQSGDTWGGETGNDNQAFGGYRGRGRGGRGRGNYEGGRGNYEGGRGNYEGGRGNYEGGRGNYEGGRGGGGRGRGRGGRGNYGNRSFEESSQQQTQRQQPPQPTEESNEWQQSNESNFTSAHTPSAQTTGQEGDADVSMQEGPFEPSGNRRGGRGFRSRTFHNNRQYGGDRHNQYEREGGQDEYRHNRRLHDRQSRTNVSSVKPIEKKDGEGAHNWGNPVENPDDHPVPDETAETTGQTATVQKDWAQQVDEAEKQMTLDEYKKQIEAKKRANIDKLPQFNRRTAGEGEDPKTWHKFEQEYRKKSDGDEGSDQEELEEGADSEDENYEENEEEQTTGKKKVITIPLRFKPIELPRGGPAGSRGGPRRGSGRFHDRPNRDEHPRSTSPNQPYSSMYPQTGEYQNTEQQQQHQSRPFRGGSRPGRNEYRRSYGNSARGSRGGYNRSNTNPNTPDLDNTVDFPTLLKK